MRGCFLYEDGTMSEEKPCRIKADPIDHPDISAKRQCDLVDNKSCFSPFVQGMTKTVDNKNDCQKWCETRSFSPGSGCQFVKATNICGITYSCGTIGVAPTHFGELVHKWRWP